MSRTTIEPMIEPKMPDGWMRPSPTSLPSSAYPSQPPTNEPITPRIVVGRHPLGLGPLTMARARSPARNPMIKKERKDTGHLRGGRAPPAFPIRPRDENPLLDGDL